MRPEPLTKNMGNRGVYYEDNVKNAVEFYRNELRKEFDRLGKVSEGLNKENKEARRYVRRGLIFAINKIDQAFQLEENFPDDKVSRYILKRKKMKCKTCGTELPEKVKTITIDGYKYETEEHDFGKCLKDIEIPKGAELWDYEDCIKFYNDEKLRELFNLDDCWFFIKQPFKLNKENESVAWFGAGSDGAVLGCNGDPTSSIASIGVRFKWKVRK